MGLKVLKSPVGHVDALSALSLPADPTIVAFGDGKLGRGGGNSHSGAGSGAIVQLGLALHPFGSTSSRKRSRDLLPRSP